MPIILILANAPPTFSKPMSKRIHYSAVFFKGEDGYAVVFPDLPGCVTQGDTLEEATEMAIDAASGWIAIMLEDGENIPPPSKHLRLSDYNGATCIKSITLDIGEEKAQ